MSQNPTADCQFCNGTGTVTSGAATLFPTFVAGNRCVCTVTDQEIEAVLPSMFEEILARAGRDKS